MRTALAGLFSLALLAPPAAAQNNDCIKDLKMPAVGKWAEYEGIMNKKDPYTIRYAVVGTERREGAEMKWLEMKMTGQKEDQSMVYQMLTPGTPGQMDQVQEIVFKPGGKDAMKMNGMMMQMIRGQLKKNPALSNVCEGTTVAGEESVTVPAGTFKATRLHNSKYESDTWVVPSLPFYMVKSQGKDFEFNLKSTGDGAESSITETPKEMGGPS